MKSKEAFEIAFEWILIAEGGKGIIPGDPGGYTSFGISQQFLDSHYPGRKAKDTTLEEAKDIYYEHFWPRGRYHNFETFNVALMYFDAAVNHGPGIAHRQWLTHRSNLKAWFESRERLYRNLADKHEWAARILKGWLNRLAKLRKFMEERG